MTTPVSGPIKISDIRTEFGRAAPDGDTTGTAVSLGKYRVNDAATFNRPLDVGVPQSGTIKLSDLRGRTRNVIFRYGGEFRRDLDAHKPALNIASVYNADENNYNDVSATTSDSENVPSLSRPLRIGQFAGRPSDTSDTSRPVILTVQVTGILGSERTTPDNPSKKFVALDTGSVGSAVSMRIEVSGEIYGAGGSGGSGSSGDGDGSRGLDGTYAIGVRDGNASVLIINSGTIQAGYGGGGGGGGSYDDPSKSTTDPVCAGGGGGGGAGFPNGLGGAAGTNSQKAKDSANDGGRSTKTALGIGGDGATPKEGDANGGAGGDGGEDQTAAEVGESPTDGNKSNGDGGPAGSDGAAIIKLSGASFTLVGAATSGGTETLPAGINFEFN